MATMSLAQAALENSILLNEQILQRLNDELQNVDCNITLKTTQLQENEKLANQALTKITSIQQPLVKSVKPNISQPNLDEHLDYIQTLKSEADQLAATQLEQGALLNGLSLLTGITGVEVVTNTDILGNLVMSIRLSACTADISLSSGKKVVGIKITQGFTPINLANLLDEAESLTPPQDLRHVVLALGLGQHFAAVLQQHLTELRKQCLVKVINNPAMRGKDYASSSSVAPCTVTLTVNNGLTATVSVLDSYASVPGSVQVTALLGLGGWAQHELTAAKSRCNARGFNNLLDVYTFLCKEGR